MCDSILKRPIKLKLITKCSNEVETMLADWHATNDQKRHHICPFKMFNCTQNSILDILYTVVSTMSKPTMTSDMDGGKL